MIDDDEPTVAACSLDHAEWAAYLRLIRGEIATLSPAAAQCIDRAQDILHRERTAGARLPAAIGASALRQ